MILLLCILGMLVSIYYLASGELNRQRAIATENPAEVSIKLKMISDSAKQDLMGYCYLALSMGFLGFNMYHAPHAYLISWGIFAFGVVSLFIGYRKLLKKGPLWDMYLTIGGTIFITVGLFCLVTATSTN